MNGAQKIRKLDFFVGIWEYSSSCAKLGYSYVNSPG